VKEFIRIGVDLAKNYFQVHALESADGRATTRKLSRQAMRKFFLETKPCLVGMEACGSAHYWSRGFWCKRQKRGIFGLNAAFREANAYARH